MGLGHPCKQTAPFCFDEILLLGAVFADLSLSESPLVQDQAWFKTVFNKNSNLPTQLSLLTFGSKAWRSGESTVIPPMWPGFESWRQRHMWVEFVVGSLPCSERFFLRVLWFSPLLKNQHFQIPIRSKTQGDVSTSSHELLNAPWVNKLQLHWICRINLVPRN